tara:strand:+ start:519 stop:704 length:186 start_codon:yes stop_codon:yes gene_type:complete
MQFIKKTSNGGLSRLFKLLIKVILACFLLFIAIMLVNKVDFPAPNKKIEKIIPNENFKSIK